MATLGGWTAKTITNSLVSPMPPVAPVDPRMATASPAAAAPRRPATTSTLNASSFAGGSSPLYNSLLSAIFGNVYGMPGLPGTAAPSSALPGYYYPGYPYQSAVPPIPIATSLAEQAYADSLAARDRAMNSYERMLENIIGAQQSQPRPIGNIGLSPGDTSAYNAAHNQELAYRMALPGALRVAQSAASAPISFNAAATTAPRAATPQWGWGRAPSWGRG